MESSNAWNISLDRPVNRSTRIIEFALFALIPLDNLTFFGRNVPLAEIAAVGIVLFAMAVPGPDRRRPPGTLVAAAALFLCWTVAVAYASGEMNLRRLGHIALFLALAYVLAVGRADVRSAARGLGAGLGIGLISGLVLWNQSLYLGRLTG